MADFLAQVGQLRIERFAVSGQVVFFEERFAPVI